MRVFLEEYSTRQHLLSILSYSAFSSKYEFCFFFPFLFRRIIACLEKQHFVVNISAICNAEKKWLARMHAFTSSQFSVCCRCLRWMDTTWRLKLRRYQCGSKEEARGYRCQGCRRLASCCPTCPFPI